MAEKSWTNLKINWTAMHSNEMEIGKNVTRVHLFKAAWFSMKSERRFNDSTRFCLIFAFLLINFKSILMSLVIETINRKSPISKNNPLSTKMKLYVVRINWYVTAVKYPRGWLQSNGYLQKRIGVEISENRRLHTSAYQKKNGNSNESLPVFEVK